MLPLFSAVGVPVAGAASSRTVTASVTCTDKGSGGQPQVSVKITNHAGAPLIVGYVHGFTTPQTFVVLMNMVDPGKRTINTVPDKGSKTIKAPWDDLRQDSGEVGAALVVTNLGALTPTCSSNGKATLTLGAAPATAQAAKEEAVTIAAKTLGELEVVACVSRALCPPSPRRSGRGSLPHRRLLVRRPVRHTGRSKTAGHLRPM